MTNLIYRGVRYDKSMIERPRQSGPHHMTYRGVTFLKHANAVAGETRALKEAKMCYRGVSYWKASAPEHDIAPGNALFELPLAA